METQTAKTIPRPEVPDASDVKIKINTLLYGILPGWTTLAEMEMVAARVFEMVESQWKYGGSPKVENNSPEAPRDSGRFA